MKSGADEVVVPAAGVAPGNYVGRSVDLSMATRCVATVRRLKGDPAVKGCFYVSTHCSPDPMSVADDDATWFNYFHPALNHIGGPWSAYEYGKPTMQCGLKNAALPEDEERWSVPMPQSQGEYESTNVELRCARRMRLYHPAVAERHSTQSGGGIVASPLIDFVKYSWSSY